VSDWRLFVGKTARDAIAAADLDAIQDWLDDKGMDPDVRFVAEGCISLARKYADPGFHVFVALLDQFLEDYPGDIFVGGEGADSGVEFVVALRRARERLAERMVSK
jgi:hypothetical protein